MSCTEALKTLSLTTTGGEIPLSLVVSPAPPKQGMSRDSVQHRDLGLLHHLSLQQAVEPGPSASPPPPPPLHPHPHPAPPLPLPSQPLHGEADDDVQEAEVVAPERVRGRRGRVRRHPIQTSKSSPISATTRRRSETLLRRRLPCTRRIQGQRVRSPVIEGRESDRQVIYQRGRPPGIPGTLCMGDEAPHSDFLDQSGSVPPTQH